jgi:beta-lactamase superfamily II metal-dependent hydrolase
MYEVDFLPIEKTGDLGSKSGDAIVFQFTESGTGARRVVVIDGGYGHTGDQLVDHITKWYETDQVDLVISTHPDQDHINGLGSVLDAFNVTELMIHNPHNHANDTDGFSNIEVVDALIGLAEDGGVTVTEPFTGLTKFAGHLRIIGPTQAYYKELLAEHLAEVSTGQNAARIASASHQGRFSKAADLLERFLANVPLVETLSEDSETSPRNSSSVVTLLTTDNGERMLFTGDAGITAMNAAWDEYELVVGAFPDFPLDFFQAPHHGSKRNLSPSVLNRIFGRPGENLLAPTSFISSARNDIKHPSPKVTNALKRRNVDVYATESKALLHKSADLPMRPGYGPVTAIPALKEDDD